MRLKGVGLVKRSLRRLLGSGLALLLACGVLVPAGANSALKEWRGRGGAVLSPGDGCPVEVLHESLTVKVSEVPLPYDGRAASDGVVTARYTLNNPAPYGVGVRLFFPVGASPYGEGMAAGTYGVAVNGAPAAVTRRFSYPAYTDFNTEEELEKLSDTPVPRGAWGPGTRVTDYRFTFQGLPEGQTDAVLEFTGPGTALVYNAGEGLDYMSFEKISENSARFCVKNGCVCRVAVIGEGERGFAWRFAAANGGEAVAGAAEKTAETETAFSEFASSFGPAGSPIPETDRCNAVSAELYEITENGAAGLFVTDGFCAAVDAYYAEWYEYTLEFAPGETLENTVTAPFYPDIDARWDPPKYGFAYLLSPAAGWAAFRGLDVELQTPFELLDCSLNGFEKTDTGYYLHADGLPEGELEFTLCAEARPKRDRASVRSELTGWLIIAPFALTAAAAAVIVVLGVRAALKKRRALPGGPAGNA
jgi:hypothetical protein